MNVIFNRPVKLGKTLHRKDKKPVVIDDKYADNWFVKSLMESGDISVVVAKAEKVKAAAPEKSSK